MKFMSRFPQNFYNSKDIEYIAKSISNNPDFSDIIINNIINSNDIEQIVDATYNKIDLNSLAVEAEKLINKNALAVETEKLINKETLAQAVYNKIDFNSISQSIANEFNSKIETVVNNNIVSNLDTFLENVSTGFTATTSQTTVKTFYVTRARKLIFLSVHKTANSMSGGNITLNLYREVVHMANKVFTTTTDYNKPQILDLVPNKTYHVQVVYNNKAGEDIGSQGGALTAYIL